MYRFDYQRPVSRADALTAFEGDSRYLAGGQSLVQAMKLRMSAWSTSAALPTWLAFASRRGRSWSAR
jgi:hypothetical protein